jgi:hypothetical protein
MNQSNSKDSSRFIVFFLIKRTQSEKVLSSNKIRRKLEFDVQEKSNNREQKSKINEFSVSV